MIDLAKQHFGVIADLIHTHARQSPQRPALRLADRTLSYAELDQAMDQVAWSLQRDGLTQGDVIAVCAATSIAYALVFLGALRAGIVVAPLAPGSSPHSLSRMLADSQARMLFADTSAPLQQPLPHQLACIALDSAAPGQAWDAWLGKAGQRPSPAQITPAAAFNIIYSSGTTGEPKGIVQPHSMRWAHVQRGLHYGYGTQTVTLLSTPLYSNTTLVVFFPTLAYGGCVVLMPRFDTLAYLEQAQALRASHTMLVPVQYQRLMARAEFDRFDLGSFVAKFSTSAPFAASLKADVLRRWPGALIEFYGMTEGGGTCILEAHRHPDKLHTVGRPAEGHDIRLIGDDGQELAAGAIGEVVGHSAGMMKGYHGQPERTREAEWFDAQGKRFIRTGDIGRFDADGFLTLLDRKKDMVISGGFNIYPSDIEAQLRSHPDVADAAVFGLPSQRWGESPVAVVVAHAGHALSADELLGWVNARVGKTQRLAALELRDELPRSAIGKVLKRELREAWLQHGPAID